MADSLPMTGGGARMALLQAVCAVAEHGQVQAHAEHEPAAAHIVRAVLRNTRSFSNLNGVTGLPRSLNSVYAAAVALYLDAGFRGRLTRTIAQFGERSPCFIAVTRDGCFLLACSNNGKLHVINSSTGSVERVIGGVFRNFFTVRQVCVASDDYVYVTEWFNRGVQVFDPGFEFHARIKTKHHPYGVCADSGIVAVSEPDAHRISVYSRRDSVLLRRMGSKKLAYPTTLCILPNRRQIACADSLNNRVSVFSVHGELVKHIPLDNLSKFCGLATSSDDELVVATRNRIVVFDAAGQERQSIEIGGVLSIVLHGASMYIYSLPGSRLQVVS